MNSSIPLALVAIGLLVFLAHLFAALYNKKMVPDVLLLMIVGLIIGPALGIVSPGDFGFLGPVFTSITLVVILFESGTTLSLSMLKSSWKSTLSLTVVGFLGAVLIITAIAFLLLGFTLSGAISLGAILGGTSSAVVIPLVKQLNIGENSRTSLILESAITDVLCIVVTLACVQSFQSGDVSVSPIFWSITLSFVLAILIGVTAALVWSRILELMRQIQNSIFTTPAFVFVVYGITELLGFNGAIAALAFGITLANIDLFPDFVVQKVLGSVHKLNDTEIIFLREITFLLKTFFFVYIGLSIVFDDLKSILIGLIITGTLYLIRLFVAKIASPKGANSFDKGIIAIMTPKGLAAAVLATIPAQAGMPDGLMIKNITYSVVFFSILATSVLIFLNNRQGGLRRFYNAFFK
ncbi:MAG: cation:proton antiporter [Bacteroidetes bacterium]|nr:cation:proton antiporter [Bacteroidota bacterium]